MDMNLTEPRFAQPDVLKVTRLKSAVLQTWVNRNAIELSEQNPGSGRRRLYSALDIVKLAIMRRMADLRVELAVAKEIAEAAADELARHGKYNPHDFIFLRPNDATDTSGEPKITIIMASSMSKLVKYDATIMDPAFVSVSKIIEPGQIQKLRHTHGDSLEALLDGVTTSENLTDRWNNSERDDVSRTIEAERQRLAAQGIHSEPVIIIPLGEIVNGALAQLRVIEAKPVTEAH